MATKYLDSTGLAHLVGKIKTYVTNAVKVTGVKGNSESSYRTGNVNITADNVGAVPYDGTIFNTNSFTSEKYRKLYISKIDNAFFALDKRYNVTVTYDGTDIPNVAQFFDGSYEGNSLHVAEGKTATFTLDFSNGSGQKFAGYPYGYVYVSFYNRCIPDTITGRVYNNYASQGVGWHDITFEQYDTSMYRARQSYYGLQTLEITITGSSNTPYGYTSPIEIEMQIDRPDPTQHSSIINKYSAQTLFYNLTAPKFIGDLQGTADKAKTDINGNTIIGTYLTKAAGVTNVAYDSTNKKLTKTINGTTSDIVTLSTLKTAMSLNNVANGAEVNQNAFSHVKVGSTTIDAGAKTDTFELVAGNNIDFTPNATNKLITIAATDTVTTATTTGSGNAVTGITASNGALTVTKGSTFLTQHQDISGKADKSSTVSNVAYDSTNKKITKTINGTTSDIVTLSTLKTAMSLNNVDNTSDANKSVASAAKLMTTRYIDGLAFNGSADVCRLCAYENTTQVDNVDTVSVRAVYGSTINDIPGTIITVMFGTGVNDGNKKLRLHYEDNTYSTPAYIFKTVGERLVETIPQDSVYMFVRGFDQGLSIDGWFMIGYYDTRATYYAMTQAQATAGSSTTSMLISPKVLSTTIANAIGESGTADNIVDITSQFSSSNSRLVVRKAVKCGKNVNLMIGILRSASWSSNTSSDLTATLTSNYLPLLQSTTSYPWSTGSIEGILDGNALSFRNCSGSTISASSGNYIYMSFTYIYNDGTLS